MTSTIVVLAILPGREESWRSFAAACREARATEFAEMNKRHGLTGQRMWLQIMPEGNAIAVYALEGDGAEGFDRQVAASNHPFDTWYVDQLVSAHAIDFGGKPLAPAATLEATWPG